MDRAASYERLGRFEQARASSANVLQQIPEFSSAWFAAKESYKSEDDERHLRDGLLEAGLPS
ncbi:MAG TPA: hypothetical protein VFP43_12000 [Mesorhizobium sp.]|nr:hypothetical protein [Mesorhizobium sp.]